MDNFWCSPKNSGIVSVFLFVLSRLSMTRTRNDAHFPRSFTAMFLVQSHFFLAILALPQVVVTEHHSECTVQTHGSINEEWVHTAPARFVPAPRVDTNLQADFYNLFISQDNYTKASVRQEPLPPGILQSDLEFIAHVCPKDAFFYSMSPQHVIARNMLQQYLAAAPTPHELVRVARIILHNHEINAKIWYYALMGAVMERPDMSGLVVAQPLDAIPDLFVPAPVISEALSRYRPVFGIGDNFPHFGGGRGIGARNFGSSGGNGGGFVPSVGPVRPPPLRNVPISGLGPLRDLESGSYQSFSGPLSAASQVTEHRVKYDGGDKFGYALNYTTGSGREENEEHEPDLGINNSGFSKRRGAALRRRVKVVRRPRNDQTREKLVERMPETTTLHFMDDSAGEESIISGQAVIAPPPANLPRQSGAGIRRNMNAVAKGKGKTPRSENFSNIAPTYRSYSAEDFGATQTYGEEDDEYDELLRIHRSSSNSTRDIRHRILQRRQRRRKKEKRRAPKVKRQAFGPGIPPPSQYPSGAGDCIVINGTIGTDNGIENKLWYFREDLMVNQFHWYWHQQFPINGSRIRGHNDRRAELFFFVHRNLVARYNAERLSNGMPRTVELILRHGSILEDGYNSHLVDMNSGKFWTPREPHVPLTDILHEQDQDFARNIFMKDVHDLYHKFIYSIRDGHLVGPNLQSIPLRNFQGIDHLGNAIEATDNSVNPLYYNSIGIHNLGHQVLGLAQDPQFIDRLPTGVMADTAVTMRDPIFYTFHSGIDNIFDRHKRTLRPYQLYDGDFPLVWPGVAISNLEIISSFNDGHPNHLRTFFSRDRFPLGSGLDNSIHNGQVREDICSVHLNHEPFTYKIVVNVNPCVHSVSSQGTMRIFMAPRFDEYGQRFPLKVQRRLMFQLDSFPVQLQQGRNVILRRSQDSSLTKPWPTSLPQKAFGGGAAGASGQPAGGADFCGCGWPRHLLLPKGNAKGMQYDLFVMITNYDEDIVQNSEEDLNIPEPCNSPHLFCGIPFRRYPDSKPMGYPFDRLPYKKPVRCSPTTGYPDVVCKMLHPEWYKTVESLEEYVHPVPNMATRLIVIQHVETLVN